MPATKSTATPPATAKKKSAPEAPARFEPMGSEADPRLGALNSSATATKGAYVLYWCRAYRRAEDNLALDYACMRADALGLPLVVYEALDVRYPFASDRMHTFVLQGACSMRALVEARGASYAFYLPRSRDESKRSRALARLAERAALVVTDAYPHAGGPRSLWARSDALLAALPVRVETYDDAAAIPLSLVCDRAQAAARTLRPRVERFTPASLHAAPERTVRARLRGFEPPFEPTEVTPASVAALVAACEIDHAVGPVEATPGGPVEAKKRLASFARSGLARYATLRNDMAEVATSGLSAHLHFGHVSTRAVAMAARDAGERGAQREGAEGFLEELLVRRCLAFNHVSTCKGHATYEGAAPAWARATLEKHAGDKRAGAYTLEDWERARTSDPLWNAAQRELMRTGVIHPYARMLWGKAGLTVAPSPSLAFEWLVYMNDKYALDGRDPNTYENIAWCFGLHDHPYPERAIFGTVRSMTSRSAALKWDVDAYLRRVGAPPLPKGFARGG